MQIIFAPVHLSLSIRTQLFFPISVLQRMGPSITYTRICLLDRKTMCIILYD